MAYTDDSVLSRLSALNESHDSIATAAQWIMFHRRHADRTVQLWLQKLRDSPSPKRLNLVYLANEVTQQSKARHKDDFVVAFAPIVAEAIATAYKGATSEVQNKLRKVVMVWKDRGIFEVPIQEAVETRIEELEKSRAVPTKSFGGSIFSSTSSTPPELTALVAPQQTVSKLLSSTEKAVATADQDYEKLNNSAGPLPPAPVYAARLNGLLKVLATAEGAVQECVKARTELVDALEKMLSTNKAALETDTARLAELSSRKDSTDKKKQDVEHAIMSGLASNDRDAAHGNGGSPAPEPDRPEMEALTPPSTHDGPDVPDNEVPSDVAAPPAIPTYHSPTVPQTSTLQPSSAPGIEMLSNLASQYQAVPVSTNGANKRRRIDTSDDFPDLGNDDGIDADVKEMLREDSMGS